MQAALRWDRLSDTSDSHRYWIGSEPPAGCSISTSEVGEDGKPYDGGTNKHVVHFDKGQIPPVDGFWSLTMCNGQYFLWTIRWTATP
jgi:hypothetical protein